MSENTFKKSLVSNETSDRCAKAAFNIKIKQNFEHIDLDNKNDLKGTLAYYPRVFEICKMITRHHYLPNMGLPDGINLHKSTNIKL